MKPGDDDVIFFARANLKSGNRVCVGYEIVKARERARLAILKFIWTKQILKIIKRFEI